MLNQRRKTVLPSQIDFRAAKNAANEPIFRIYFTFNKEFMGLATPYPFKSQTLKAGFDTFPVLRHQGDFGNFWSEAVDS